MKNIGSNLALNIVCGIMNILSALVFTVFGFIMTLTLALAYSGFGNNPNEEMGDLVNVLFTICLVVSLLFIVTAVWYFVPKFKFKIFPSIFNILSNLVIGVLTLIVASGSKMDSNGVWKRVMDGFSGFHIFGVVVIIFSVLYLVNIFVKSKKQDKLNTIHDQITNRKIQPAAAESAGSSAVAVESVEPVIKEDELTLEVQGEEVASGSEPKVNEAEIETGEDEPKNDEENPQTNEDDEAK